MMADERRPLLSRYQRTRERNLVRPRQRSKKAYLLILVAQAFERLAFYTLTATIISLLTNKPLCWSRSEAALALSLFTAASYATGLFGGWISDSYIERFWTIFIGYIFYMIGYGIILFEGYNMSNPPSSAGIPAGTSCVLHEKNSDYSSICSSAQSQKIAMCISLGLVSLAAGLVRINLVTFGGEQVRELGPNATRKFFTYYYWAVNCGALLALAGAALLIQWEGFFAGYVVACTAVVFSFIAFVAGKAFYITGPAENSDIFGVIIKIIYNAYKVKKGNPSLKLPTFTDYANVENPGGKFNVMQISDIKLFGRALVTFLLMIPYWICYSQMDGNFFQLQGVHLRVEFEVTEDLHTCNRSSQSWNDYCANSNLTTEYHIQQEIQHDEFQVPANTLTVFNVLFVVACLPFLQRLYRYLASRGIRVYTWRRLLFGMILGAFALLATGILETLRLKNISDCGCKQQKIDGIWYNSAPNILIWWQIPQYCLLGASEIFFIVTALEYAYTEAPRNMQGILMGLYSFVSGIGYFVGFLLSSILKEIDISKGSTDMNCDHLDIMLYALAGLLFIYVGVFRVVVHRCDLGLNRIIIEEPDRDPAEDIRTPEVVRRLINTHSSGDADSSSELLS